MIVNEYRASDFKAEDLHLLAQLSWENEKQLAEQVSSLAVKFIGSEASLVIAPKTFVAQTKQKLKEKFHKNNDGYISFSKKALLQYLSNYTTLPHDYSFSDPKTKRKLEKTVKFIEKTYAKKIADKQLALAQVPLFIVRDKIATVKDALNLLKSHDECAGLRHKGCYENIATALLDVRMDLVNSWKYIENPIIQKQLQKIFTLQVHLLAEKSFEQIAFYEVYRDKQKIAYLMPTIHALSIETQAPFPASIQAALKTAGALYLEIDVSLKGQEREMLDICREIYWQKYNSFYDRKVISLYEVQRADDSYYPFARQVGAEMRLVALAAENQVPVESLETLEEQGEALAIYIKNFFDVKRASKLTFSDELNLSNLQHWLEGKIELHDADKFPLFFAAETIDNLHERNKRMSDRIIDICAAKNQLPFVAIGLRHFGSNKGILQLLRDRGCEIVKIN